MRSVLSTSPRLGPSRFVHHTCTERVAIGEAIEAELGNRQGQRTDMEPVENFPQVALGEKTRDLAAKAAGFGNTCLAPVQRPLKPNPNRLGYRWVSRVAKAPRWSRRAGRRDRPTGPTRTRSAVSQDQDRGFPAIKAGVTRLSGIAKKVRLASPCTASSLTAHPVISSSEEISHRPNCLTETKASHSNRQ